MLFPPPPEPPGLAALGLGAGEVPKPPPVEVILEKTEAAPIVAQAVGFPLPLDAPPLPPAPTVIG